MAGTICEGRPVDRNSKERRSRRPGRASAAPREGKREGRRVDTAAIFEILRYRISTLDYPPGTALKELELAAEFNVSRTPIRQALQRLELAGLILPVIGHGTFVSDVDFEQMRHLLEYRLQLARLLEGFLDLSDTAEVLVRLRKAQAQNAALSERFSAKRFATISHEVRWVICERIANPFLAQSWIDSYYRASRLWFLSLAADKRRFVDLQAREIAVLIESFETAEPKAVARAVHDTLQTWITAIWQAVAAQSPR